MKKLFAAYSDGIGRWHAVPAWDIEVASPLTDTFHVAEELRYYLKSGGRPEYIRPGDVDLVYAIDRFEAEQKGGELRARRNPPPQPAF